MKPWQTITLAQVFNIGALVGALCFQRFARAQRRPVFPKIMLLVAVFTVGFLIFDIFRFRHPGPVTARDFLLVLGSILLMHVLALLLWHRPAEGYFQRTIAEHRPALKPRVFLWQGVLILLPVAVLAIAGVWSLEQDRAAVESQARNRADTLAAGALADLEDFLRQVISATARGATNGWTMRTNLDNFILDAQDRLSSPRPLIWPPVPAPLPEDLSTLLNSNRLRQWRAAESAFAERDWEGAAQLYFDFLDRRAQVTSEPMADFHAGIRDPRFRGRALINRAFAYEQLGETNLAIEAYNDVFDGFNVSHGTVAESGLPLWPIAALKILDLTHDDPSRLPAQWQHNPMGLAYALNNQPSPFDPELHARLKALGPALARTSDFHWTPEQLFSTWKESDANRQRYTEAAAQLGKVSPWPAKFWVDGEFPWLAVAQAWPTNQKVVSGERWYVAFPESRLAQELAASLDRHGAAGDFAFQAVISGRVVGRRDNGTFSARSQSVDQSLVIAVSLADPAAFFAAQQHRQWLFSALLLASALSALAGYFAARRAFYRQLRLNQMKSDFVSSVSHELRAPIASVRLMAEGLERGKIQDAAKQAEYFRFIGQECRRLSSLIENVLDFSRIEQGRKQYEMESTDLVALAQQTVKLMETYAAERQIGMTLNITGTPVPVELDGKAIQQALINLIDNALKHSPKNSVINVGLEFSTPNVRLWVEDHGEGIPAAEHEKIFERFYRVGSELRRETQGVGIGLSIVKHIVEAHRGRVIVRSAPGQGSRFTIELPLQNKDWTQQTKPN